MIIEKYNQRVDKVNSLVCVGLDSEIGKLPERFKQMENPQFEFNKWIIDQTAEFTAAFKPNIAFYEARGDQGLRELKMTMEYLREKYSDIFTICDAKRGDIGNTNNGYVEEIFDWLGFDAITLHPFLGQESVKPFLDRKDKASIFLCRTSNPKSSELQDLNVQTNDLNVTKFWHLIAQTVAKNWNYNNNCMLVLGATYPDELRQAREIAPFLTFLVPGIGAQGGDVKVTVEVGLNKKKRGMIINSSRGIIFAENPAVEAKKLRDEINQYR